MSIPLKTVNGVRTHEHEQVFLLHGAQDIQQELQRRLDIEIPGEPVVLDDEIFAGMYDDTKPTIAIDILNNFAGAELIGYGMTQQEQAAANIIYFGGPHNGLVLTDGRLQLTSGIVCLPDGRCAFGDLPAGVAVSMIETGDDVLLEQCHQAGVATMTSLDTLQKCTDKTRLAELFPGHDGLLPARFPADALRDMRQPVVIKPSRDAQGTGVFISSTDTPNAALGQAYTFMESSGYAPIVEERILSRPLYDPATGKRLDWNVRAIVSNGQYIDMYFRADTWGKPVNKSRGSHVILKQGLAAYTSNAEQAAAIIDQLEQAAATLATSLGNGVLGLDMTIDETGTTRLFEVNAGNVGGLQTIAELSGDATWLRNTARLIDGALQRLESFPDTKRTMQQLGRFAVSPLTMVRANEMAGKSDEPHDSAVVDSLDFRARNITFNRLLETRLQLQNPGFVRDETVERRQAELDDILMSQYPLELRRHAAELITEAEDVSIYAAFVDKLGQLYPNEIEWSFCRGLVAVRTIDLKAVRAVYDSLSEATDSSEDVAGILTEELQQSLMFPAATAATPEVIISALAAVTKQAVQADYASATAQLTTLNKEYPEHHNELHTFGMMLAVSAGDYQQAYQEFSALYQANGAPGDAFSGIFEAEQGSAEDIYQYIAENSDVRKAFLRDPAGAAVLGSIYTDLGMRSAGLITITRDGNTFFKRFSPTELDRVAATYSTLYADATEPTASDDLHTALEKVMLADYGNAAACCPIALDETSTPGVKYAFLIWHFVQQCGHPDSQRICHELRGKGAYAADLDFLEDWLASFLAEQQPGDSPAHSSH